MKNNITVCKDTFNNFYEYWNHKSEQERKIVQSSLSNFEKMSMVDSFSQYINSEIPKFDTKWMTD